MRLWYVRDGKWVEAKKENKMAAPFTNIDEMPNEIPRPKTVSKRESVLSHFKNYGQVYVSSSLILFALDSLVNDLGLDHFGIRSEGLDVWVIYALP